MIAITSSDSWLDAQHQSVKYSSSDAAAATATRYQQFDQIHQQHVTDRDCSGQQIAAGGAAAAKSPPPSPDSNSSTLGACSCAAAGAPTATNRDSQVRQQVYQPIATPDVHGTTGAADWGVRPATARPLPVTPAVKVATPHVQQWVSADISFVAAEHDAFEHVSCRGRQ
jgi:hypothetical protein